MYAHFCAVFSFISAPPLYGQNAVQQYMRPFAMLFFSSVFIIFPASAPVVNNKCFSYILKYNICHWPSRTDCLCITCILLLLKNAARIKQYCDGSVTARFDKHCAHELARLRDNPQSRNFFMLLRTSPVRFGPKPPVRSPALSLASRRRARNWRL